MTGSVSERLADYVVGVRFEDLPTAVVEHAKDLVVYDLSLAFAGRFRDDGRAAVTLARRLSAGGEAATIVAHRERATLLEAIYAHSELLGDEEDVHHRAKLRAGKVAHPVAWVLGEHERTSGREFIAALVAGYEVACKLAEAQPMGGDYARMPHKCAFGAFPAAVIAARLFRQDRGRAAETIARAAHFGMGVNEGYNDALVFSLMARNGVVGALMPPLNWRETLGAIESPHGLYAAFFDGPPDRLEASLASLGREYSIFDSLTKRYPGSGSHVAALETASALLAESGLGGRDVAHLVAVLPEEFRGRFGKREGVIERVPPREADLVSSLRLRLAVLLVTGAIIRPTLADLHDPNVQAVLPKIELRFEPRPDDYARIEIETTDGRAPRREGAIAPLPKGDWPGWLRRDGERFLSEGTLAKLERLLAHLEDVTDVGEVLRSTVPDR